jgi:hypothetical protein
VLDRLEEGEGRPGRFRAFLRTALRNYAHDLHDAETARKRKPGGQVVSLDRADAPDLPDVRGGLSPEEEFDFAWAVALLAEAIRQVRDDCQRDGLAVHWRVFQVTALRGTFLGQQTPTMLEVCAREGIASSGGVRAENRAPSMKFQVQRRLRRAIRQRVLAYVDAEEEADRELRDIQQILGQDPARLADGLRSLL